MSGYSRTTSITLQDPDPAELWRLAPTVERDTADDRAVLAVHRPRRGLLH
jgi:hypothetical protein